MSHQTDNKFAFILLCVCRVMLLEQFSFLEIYFTLTLTVKNKYCNTLNLLNICSY